MRKSKYDTEYSTKNALEAIGTLIRIGNIKAFSQMFPSISKIELSEYTGIDYSRIKLLNRKPSVVSPNELEIFKGIFKECTEDQVKTLFNGNG